MTDLIVLFSGGRTSGVMSKLIKDNWSDKYNLHFVFANTGLENEETLKFVNLCDIHFNLNAIWIEADVKTKGVGTSYKIIDYESASRSGVPFEDMVKKFGLPNQDFPHCTRELKIEPIKKWALDYVSKDYKLALGIRSDEPSRLKQTKTDNEKLFPLAHVYPMSKGDVLYWWKKQSFDLELPEHLGNCETCFKKSDKKLWTIAKNHPEKFDFIKRIEKQYALISNFDRKDKRVMFRGYRTAEDILKESKKPFKEFVEQKRIQQSLFIDECAEECGSVWMAS